MYVRKESFRMMTSCVERHCFIATFFSLMRSWGLYSSFYVITSLFRVFVFLVCVSDSLVSPQVSFRTSADFNQNQNMSYFGSAPLFLSRRFLSQVWSTVKA